MCRFFHYAIDYDGVIATFSSAIFLMLNWMEESKEKLTMFITWLWDVRLCACMEQVWIDPSILHGCMVDRNLLNLMCIHGEEIQLAKSNQKEYVEGRKSELRRR
jgi:hypothetical protein